MNSATVAGQLCTVNSKSATREPIESIQLEENIVIESEESNSVSSSVNELPEQPVMNVSEDTYSSLSAFSDSQVS